jgi:L-fuconolactonase
MIRHQRPGKYNRSSVSWPCPESLWWPQGPSGIRLTIDSHQHFWRYNPTRDVWITEGMSVLKRDFLPGDLLPELGANGMDACVAVQADQSEKETLFLLDLAERHQPIVGVVGWVDLFARNLPERLQYFSQFEKLRGFRHIVEAEPDDRFLMRTDFLRGIGCLAEFHYTFDLLIYPKQLPAAIELVAKFPGQRFVVDHMAKPAVQAGERTGTSSEWARHLRAIAANANVYCKLSGLITEADWRHWRAQDFTPYLDVAFEAFGPDRLMFGSDWPVCLLAGTYRQVKQLIVDYWGDRRDAEKEKIFGANAARFYGLKN